MKTAFLVRTRDKKPFFSVLVSENGSKFTALTENAKELVSALVDEYEDSPIPKAELSVSLDRGMTIDGPMPQTSLPSAIEKARMEAEEASKQKKTLSPVSISDSPISVFSTEEAKAIISYKASAFASERYKTTFNYEIKRVRATWDPSLSIPGTNRRGGWRCPTGTRYGGQITDRFGRNCGWGVARRIANAITNIGERLEDVDDRRRGRRVNRRNDRMIGRLQNAERGGRLERGLRGIADRLEGDNQNQIDASPTRRMPDRQPARAPQQQRRERDVTPIEIDAPAPVRRPRGANQRNRGGNLRTSEQRRMEREIVQPGAPRTDENAPRVEAQNAPEAVAPTPRPRRQRRRVASEQQAERTATRRPRNEEPVIEDRPARKPSKRVNNVADQGAIDLGSKWTRRENGDYEREGFILTLDTDEDGKVTGGTVKSPDGDTYQADFRAEQNGQQYKKFADYLYGIAGGEVTKTPDEPASPVRKQPKGRVVAVQDVRNVRIPEGFQNGEPAHGVSALNNMIDDLPIQPWDQQQLKGLVRRLDKSVDDISDQLASVLDERNPSLPQLREYLATFDRAMERHHGEIADLRKSLNDEVQKALRRNEITDRADAIKALAIRLIEVNNSYDHARAQRFVVLSRINRNAEVPAPEIPNAPQAQNAPQESNVFVEKAPRSITRLQISKEIADGIQAQINAEPNPEKRAQKQDRWDLLKVNVEQGVVQYEVSNFRQIASGRSINSESVQMSYRRRGANIGITSKLDAERKLSEQKLLLERELRESSFIDSLENQNLRTAIQQRMVNVLSLENALKNWDSDTALFQRAIGGKPNYFDPNAKDAQQKRQALGDIGDNINSEISNAINKRQGILAKYIEGRYGKNQGPWREMTPEAWQALPEDQKIQYLKNAYSHDKVTGLNGKLYRFSASVNGRNGYYTVDVQISEIDANGNILRARVGRSGREINIADGKVKNGTFFIDKQSDKGAGLQTIYNQHAFMYLGQIGVYKAEVGLAVDDGMFVWPRVGFKRGKPNVVEFQDALQNYIKFGPGGLISNDEEYWRVRYLVDKANGGGRVSHQDFIFAVTSSIADKQQRYMREEQLKQWFKNYAPFRGGVLDFREQRVGPNPGQNPIQPRRRRAPARVRSRV